jgi:hypothetical protein
MGLGHMTMDHMQVRQVELWTRVQEPANGPAFERSAKGKLHLLLNVEPKRQGLVRTAVQGGLEFSGGACLACLA